VAHEEIKVSETKFNAWPPMIAGLRACARGVMLGMFTRMFPCFGLIAIGSLVPSLTRMQTK
jgi:hypothetical protein